MLNALRLAATSALLAGAFASVSAEVYRRVDDNGNITITNIPPRGTEPAATRPASPPSPNSSNPNSVSHVPPVEQRQRDDDRVRILEKELDAESAALKTAAAGKDSVEQARRQANVEALKRELGRVR